MKINPNMSIGSVAGPQQRSNSSSKGAFEDLLSAVESGAVNKPAIIGAQFQSATINPQKMNALSTSEQAIDLLQKYSQMLLNPSENLKSIEPMTKELEAMSAKVNDAASFISDSDPLKGIMEEVSSTLNSEVMRFKRGELIG